jgi:serine/threonine protein kinase
MKILKNMKTNKTIKQKESRTRIVRKLNVKRTRKIKKNKYTVIKKKRGGDHKPLFIGQGSYGCAFRPQLICSDATNPCIGMNAESPNCKGISKLMTTKNAEDEFKELSILEKVGYDTDFNYHLNPPFKCELKKEGYTLEKFIRKPKYEDKIPYDFCALDELLEEKEVSLLLYQEGHLNFNELLNHDVYYLKNKMKEYVVKKNDLLILNPIFILGENGLQNMLDGLCELQTKNLIHLDLKSENSVTNIDLLKVKELIRRVVTSTNPSNSDEIKKLREELMGMMKIRLIDFGLLSVIEEDDKIKFDENLELDFLSGENQRYDKYDSMELYDFITPQFPLYMFLIGNNELDGLVTNDEIKDAIKRHVLLFMRNSYVKSILKEYYESISVWNHKYLSDLMYELYMILKSDESGEIKNILIRSIDLFSFGIVLLNYARRMKKMSTEVYSNGDKKEKQETVLYDWIEEKILKFLKSSWLIHPVPLKVHKKKKYIFFGPTEYMIRLNYVEADVINREFKKLCSYVISKMMKRIRELHQFNVDTAEYKLFVGS